MATETTPEPSQVVSAIPSPHSQPTSKSTTTITTTNTPTEIHQKYLRRISLHPTLTPFRRRVYRALLSVPEGRWTTYSAMATYLNSSARAVGNAMRTNPFAPEVPCHRVLAADRSLGGYKGEWKVSKHIGSGSFRDEKRLRLLDEGGYF
ncbi:Winged helix-turn-helix transcription repressor DNA-binding [Penicillium cosmopolitanum]|uniref:Methylated-DNA--protein-cysteine methyltransferase n=1 Tax=Penicillium cosmopolitanum TaxID=1131564 RepID=A0A9W9W1L9_9EURO|nr:Winged helix-turn-helix transcription repressor DNA-binding [Penicillium cosmopolitanum]KAJ5396821.1 Winged helix-turn-helix transcription repressor DNA-binding [Penicillium cosmopolitanum]